MRFEKSLFLGVIAPALMAGLLAGPAAFADQGVYPKTEEEKQAAYDALNWQGEPKDYSLSRSHAQIHLPNGEYLLLGNDAQRYSWLAEGIEFPDTEAVLTLDSEDAALVYIEWRDEGYVNDSDWKDVDADELLSQYTESTEQSNEARAANGIKAMHVVGWLLRPDYDATTRTVTYALELKNDQGNWANVVALRLGRSGYAEMTWVGAIETVRSGTRPALLQSTLDAFEYDEGHRYTDFQEGDKVAAFGIGGLLAAALGVKFGAKGFAAIIAFLVAGKKVIIPAVLLGGGAIAKFWRRIFNRGGAQS